MTYNDSPLPSIVKDSDIVSILNLRYLNLQYFNSVFVILFISLGIIIILLYNHSVISLCYEYLSKSKKKRTTVDFCTDIQPFWMLHPPLGIDTSIVSRPLLYISYIYFIVSLLFQKMCRIMRFVLCPSHCIRTSRYRLPVFFVQQFVHLKHQLICNSLSSQ